MLAFNEDEINEYDLIVTDYSFNSICHFFGSRLLYEDLEKIKVDERIIEDAFL
jgi:hypothetical protein